MMNSVFVPKQKKTGTAIRASGVRVKRDPFIWQKRRTCISIPGVAAVNVSASTLALAFINTFVAAECPLKTAECNGSVKSGRY